MHPRYKALATITLALYVSPVNAELEKSQHLKWGETPQPFAYCATPTLSLAQKVLSQVPIDGVTYSREGDTVAATKGDRSVVVSDSENLDSIVFRVGDLELVDDGLNCVLTRARENGKDIFTNDPDSWKRARIIGTDRRSELDRLHSEELNQWVAAYSGK